MENCAFCSKYGLVKSESKTEPWDSVLFESKNFVVVPTLGALVEGWLLIVAKKHYLSMGALDKQLFEELQDVIEYTTDLLNNLYDDVMIFEHGPSRPKQAVGCGVDHLHLHLVPIKIDLKKASLTLLDLNWIKIDSLQDVCEYYKNDLPYLFLKQYGEMFISTHDAIPSQLFRQVIANHIGIKHEFNWRQFAGIPNILATIDKINLIDSVKLTKV